MCPTRSTTRQLYPHSLSYQASTFTVRSPSIMVEGASRIDEWGSCRKSIDTNCSSVTARMPRSVPSAASRICAFTSSTVVDLLSVAVRSTRLTSGTGTRSEMPWNLPLSSGRTRATACAAPVVVGMIDMVAARPRRRSLWGASSSTWSLVYACTVVMKPVSMPYASCRTFATGARQFVVHDALGARLLSIGEQPGRLHHNVDAQLAPGQPLRISFSENLDRFSIDDDAVRVRRDGARVATENAVVQQEVRKRIRGGDVIDGHDVESVGSLPCRTQHGTPDPPETVDADL